MPDDKALEAARVAQMIGIYCRENHSTSFRLSSELRRMGSLCPDCADLLTYAKERLIKCPYDPKPKCKECATHCYAPKFRAKIKEVMRFSGTFMVKRGRLDLLFNYFLKDKLGQLLKFKRRPLSGSSAAIRRQPSDRSG